MGKEEKKKMEHPVRIRTPLSVESQYSIAFLPIKIPSTGRGFR